MDRRKKGEYIGVLGTLLVHVAVIALLILVSFTVPRPDEDAGGVPVMMGDVDAANGFDDPSLVDVDIMDEDAAAPAETEPELPSEQDLLTQTKKETVKPKEVVKPKEPVKNPEKTEAEKAAEAKRLAEEKAERERKAAEETAKKRVSGAFGKGAQMTGNKGTATSGTGTQGSKDGNSSTGAKTGTGGEGTFDLGGRSLGAGTRLPKPECNVREEGRVVVNITVNPAGLVVGTSVNLSLTNTSDRTLRKAALDAAKKARFEAVDGVTNQTGTITYYFNLR